MDARLRENAWERDFFRPPKSAVVREPEGLRYGVSSFESFSGQAEKDFARPAIEGKNTKEYQTSEIRCENTKSTSQRPATRANKKQSAKHHPTTIKKRKYRHITPLKTYSLPLSSLALMAHYTD
ncbi:hypothetical protein QWI17_05795 [Gilvimarinus sp. SDUM040013]|uniref:hypothetical protein n=1 Tax=Gilvimarinus gilvus TaxID=3058038 RepID=UPI0026715635|nr:hypothetical protein [Gilvimarinus sp. SDUM040013]MDO3385351.1 hypothetical protein [Gilvimarinus sp. SDUM040013]